LSGLTGGGFLRALACLPGICLLCAPSLPILSLGIAFSGIAFITAPIPPGTLILLDIPYFGPVLPVIFEIPFEPFMFTAAIIAAFTCFFEYIYDNNYKKHYENKSAQEYHPITLYDTAVPFTFPAGPGTVKVRAIIDFLRM